MYQVAAFVPTTETGFSPEYAVTLEGNPNIYKETVLNERINCTMGQLYENTLRKKNKCLQLGYKYIEIDIDESLDLYAFFKKKKMVNGVPALLSFRKCNFTEDNFWVPFQATTGANVQHVTHFFKTSLE